MTFKFIKKIVVLIGFLLISSMLFAHGDLSIRIQEKTIEISKKPTDANLYYERGFLYQQHLEYQNAISDFNKSKSLGNYSKLLFFRMAETYYKKNDYEYALDKITSSITIDAGDVKSLKLKAQILFKLKRYKETMLAYTYVVENTIDIRPEDIIEYSNIVLAIDSLDYNGALEAIEIGLEKLGANTVTFQLKKIEYLKKSDQVEEVVNQYNMLIKNNNRNEFWYYEKGKYLIEVKRYHQANIAIQQAKLAIELLKTKFKSTLAIKKLQTQLNELEKSLNYE
ncbi:MAG: hypothetical protein COA88_10590 [Kordia sp.]|nr:MAG: hypothetical protein COA88_10590 [Kordia sp.]